MARQKLDAYAHGQFIPVYFNKKILKDTFEYPLSNLIENEPDLSIFDGRFCNDQIGASVYDPRILLKIILLGYFRRITASREIAKYCEENIVFMALSANSRPHFTDIADFISSMDKEKQYVEKLRSRRGRSRDGWLRMTTEPAQAVGR